MMHHISAEDGALLSGSELDGCVIDTVSRRWKKSQTRQNFLAIDRNEPGLRGRLQRPHAVVECAIDGDSHWLAKSGYGARRRYAMLVAIRESRPVIPLQSGTNMDCFWKGRPPLLIYKNRVPSDMIRVNMGVKHVIDHLGQHAKRCQPLQEGVLQVIQHLLLRPRFVIAGARVD